MLLLLLFVIISVVIVIIVVIDFCCSSSSCGSCGSLWSCCSCSSCSTGHKSHKTRPPPPIGAKKKTSCKSPHNKNKNWRDSASEIKGSSESDTQQDFPVTMQLRSWFCFELVGDCQKFVVCGSKSLRGSQFEARIDKLYLNRMRNGLYMIHVSKM